MTDPHLPLYSLNEDGDKEILVPDYGPLYDIEGNPLPDRAWLALRSPLAAAARNWRTDNRGPGGGQLHVQAVMVYNPRNPVTKNFAELIARGLIFVQRSAFSDFLKETERKEALHPYITMGARCAEKPSHPIHTNPVEAYPACRDLAGGEP